MSEDHPRLAERSTLSLRVSGVTVAIGEEALWGKGIRSIVGCADVAVRRM